MNKYFENVKNAKRVLVHGAEFHADDTFFVALATLINPALTIERSLDVDYIHERLSDPDYLIGDIGDGRYDHHLPDSPSRETGRKYASFGLLWRDVGADICGSEEVANKIDKNFISIMDANDNGDFKSFQYVYTLIRNFRASWDDPNYETTMEENFLKAVEFARTILVNMIRQEVSIARGMETLEEIYSSRDDEYIKEGIVVMPSEIPQYKNWALSKPDIRWIIFPTLRGHSIIQLSDHFPGKINPIPEKYWIGNDPNNEKGILPDGIVFCHKTGYMMAAKDLTSAINTIKVMNADVEKEFMAVAEQYASEHVAGIYYAERSAEVIDNDITIDIDYERVSKIFTEYGHGLRWQTSISAEELKSVMETRESVKYTDLETENNPLYKVILIVLTYGEWMSMLDSVKSSVKYELEYKLENGEIPFVRDQFFEKYSEVEFSKKYKERITKMFGTTSFGEFSMYAELFRKKAMHILGISETKYQNYVKGIMLYAMHRPNLTNLTK